MDKKRGITITCSRCGFGFSTEDAIRECSNCFACMGCEVYLCPCCSSEVVVRPVRQPGQGRTSASRDAHPEIPKP